jgi:hypothetical protein
MHKLAYRCSFGKSRRRNSNRDKGPALRFAPVLVACYAVFTSENPVESWRFVTGGSRVARSRTFHLRSTSTTARFFVGRLPFPSRAYRFRSRPVLHLAMAVDDVQIRNRCYKAVHSHGY